MRDHYAIVELDDKNRVSAVKIRIQDTFYFCDVHDDGVGARELFMNIDSSRPVRVQKQVPTGREKQLAQAQYRLQKMYGSKR